MSNRKRNIIIAILISIIGFAIVFDGIELRKLAADSGFDVDYGSDYYSSYDFDYDYKSNKSESKYHTNSKTKSNDNLTESQKKGFDIIIIFLIASLIFILIYGIYSIRNVDKIEDDEVNIDINEDDYIISELLKSNPNFNKEKFYKFVYDSFVRIQEAWMRFDYNELKSMLSNHLYKKYKSQLETLSSKNQTNIMKDFEKVDIAIIEFNKTSSEEDISVLLKVKFIDYIESESGELLKGNDKVRVIVTYKLTYVKPLEAHDYVLYEKKKIEQTMEE